MQNTVIILDRTLSHIIYIPLIISRCPGLRMRGAYLLCLLVQLAAAAQAKREEKKTPWSPPHLDRDGGEREGPWEGPCFAKPFSSWFCS